MCGDPCVGVSVGVGWARDAGGCVDVWFVEGLVSQERFDYGLQFVAIGAWYLTRLRVAFVADPADFFCRWR